MELQSKMLLLSYFPSCSVNSPLEDSHVVCWIRLLVCDMRSKGFHFLYQLGWLSCLNEIK